MPRSSTMLITLALLLALCLPLPAQGTAAAAALVTIDAGAVQGVAPSPDSPVRVYRGIPFARPPVGPLRWQPPQPVQPWQGIRDCTEFGPSCPQPPARIVPEIQGAKSEDCLYLNVWTAASPGDNRPVLVWIHGGGFSIGSGAQRFYDGTHFAENGAVLVTINYRLGPFGFLAHPALSAESPQNASGNFGLLDQIAALTWVRHNIAAFGGDPDRVTIFGESAGGMSVGFLLASPLASGLFHRAILQSGVPGAGSPLRDTTGPNPSAEATGIAVARELGIPDPASDSPQTAARLRDVPAETLLETTNPRVGLFGKGRRLWPVVDGHVLPRPPDHLFARGVYNHVPVLLGSNADEGTLFLRQLPIQRPAGYQLLVRTLFRDDAETVLSMFPVASPEEIKPALARLITVSAFLAPTRRTARLLAAQGNSPVFLYRFTRVSLRTRSLGFGATHGAEIPYVFHTLPQAPSSDPADRAVADAMSAAWLRFAATGDPNGPDLPDWPAYSAQNESHLEFADSPHTAQNPYTQACDLFDQINTRRNPTSP